MAVSQSLAESRKPVAVNGSVRTHDPANLKVATGSAYVFATTFNIPWNGCLLTFEQGPAYMIDAPLLAYLAANNITPTAL